MNFHNMVMCSKNTDGPFNITQSILDMNSLNWKLYFITNPSRTDFFQVLFDYPHVLLMYTACVCMHVSTFFIHFAASDLNLIKSFNSFVPSLLFPILVNSFIQSPNPQMGCEGWLNPVAIWLTAASSFLSASQKTLCFRKAPFSAIFPAAFTGGSRLWWELINLINELWCSGMIVRAVARKWINRP